jgi:hypothetical protein
MRQRRSQAPEKPPATPFDPESAAEIPNAPTFDAGDDERALEGTGLPPGSAAVNVGRDSPRFQEVLKRSGQTESKVVRIGGRDYLTPAPMTEDWSDVGAGPAQPDIPREEQAALERVVPGEAPSDARFRAGFGVDAGSAEAYQNVLGPEYETKIVESAGPMKGRVLFRKKGSKEWQLAAGQEGARIPSLADLKSVAGPAGQMAAGAVGGTLGAMIPVLNTVATGVGAGLGGGAGEFARLYAGREMGAIPKDTSNEELMARAMWTGLTEGGLAAGATVAMKIALAFKARGIDLDIDPDKLAKAIEKFRATHGEKASSKATVSDVLAGEPEGQAILAAERKFGSEAGAQGDAVRRRMAEKEGLLQSELEGATPISGRVLGDEEVGRRMATSPATPDAEAELAALGPKLNPESEGIANVLRNAVKKAEDTQEAAAKELYEKAEAPIRGAVTKPITTDITARQYDDLLQKDVFQGLSAEDTALIKGWFREAYQKGDGGQEVLKDISYETLDRGLKSLRRAIRKGYKGEWNGDLEMLMSLEDAMIADRAKMIGRLDGGSKILKTLEEAEGAWKEIKDTFRRTKLNDFFRQNQGKQALGDEAGARRVFQDSETAREMGRLLQRPEFVQERDVVRRMLRWEASRAAKPKGGDLNSEALDDWIKNNEEVLTPFFDKKEMADLFRPGAVMRARRAMQISGDMNEAQWFDRFFGQGREIDPKAAQTVMDRLRNLDPGLANDIKNMTYQRIRSMLSERTQAARGKEAPVSPEKFERFLETPGRADWLRHVLGPDFAARLRGVSEMVQGLRPQGQAVSAPPAGGGGSNVEMARAGGRLFLGYLSREARAYNSAVRMLSGSARKAYAEAILDPKKYREMLVLNRRLRSSAAIVHPGRLPATLNAISEGFSDEDQ